MDIVPQDSIYVPTTEVEIAIAQMRSLIIKEREAIRECRFQLGDIFNRIHFESGSRAVHLIEVFGDGMYKHLRECAWVAHKWPKGKRTPGKPWDYFKNNVPGYEKKPRAMRSYIISEAGEEEGRSFVVGTNSSGKSVKTFATIEQLERSIEMIKKATGDGENPSPNLSETRARAYDRPEGFGAELIHEGAAA